MPAPERSPNLLFVFSDQHRWCDLGCYGNEQVVSPHLDAFALRAVRFSHCIANSPVCVPSRGSLLTGLFPLRHRAITNDLPLRTDVTSIADVLAGNGYQTGYIGKWHLAGVPRDQFIPAGRGRLGFAEWKVCECSHAYLNAYYYDENNHRIPVRGYEPIEQTSLAIDFVQRHRGTPWALFLSWGPPHDPYHAVPPQYLKLYEGRELRLRPNVPDVIRPSLRQTLTRQHILRNQRGYYAHITALDEQFGRLLAALEATGQAESTVVVYTSDHGDMLGSQGLTNKQLPYEESIRVPLLVCWKDRTLPAATDEMIGLVDLPVSLLGLLGLRFPGDVDGRDLHALFTDRGARGLDECYIFDLVPCHQAMARGGTEWRGIRTRRHTFARSAADEGHILFDNQADPFQMANLVRSPEAEPLRRDLLRGLDALIARHDRLLPWPDFIRHVGLTAEWNRSQAYFRLPLLE